MNLSKLEMLRKVRLLSGLPETNLQSIAQITKKENYKKGQVIFSEQTHGAALYILISGRIKIFTQQGKRRKVLAYLEPGEFFGELSILDGQIRSASAQAIEDCEILTLHRNDFWELLKTFLEICSNLIKVIAGRLRQADKEIESLSFHNVIGRISRTLLDLGKKYGKRTVQGIEIDIPLDHREISELAGTVREMVTRVLNHLRKLDYIDYSNNSFVILNEDKLKNFLE